MDDKQRTETAKWLFERTLGWIGSADVKVGVAMALDTAMIGGLAAAYSASAESARTTWCYLFLLSAVSGMVVAMFCAAMAAIPRMQGPVSSMIYFGRIAEKEEDEFVDQFERINSQDFLRDLTTQIHRNSQIAEAKHWWIRKSLTWSFAAAAPWLSAVVLLVV